MRTQKDLATKIVAITVSELNDMVPLSKVKGLRIRISDNRRTVGLATYQKNDLILSLNHLENL